MGEKGTNLWNKVKDLWEYSLKFIRTKTYIKADNVRFVRKKEQYL